MNHLLRGALAAGAASLFASPALAQQGPGPGWGGHMMYGWGGGGGYFGMGFMLIFWVLIIVALVGGIRWIFQNSGKGQATHKPDRSLAILKERYAKGEINKEQYEQMKADLES